MSTLQPPSPPNEMLKREELTFSFQVPRFIKSAGAKGTTGFFASLFLDIIHPLSGAIFASTQSVMQQLLWPGVEQLLSEDSDNLPSRIYIYVVTFLFSSTVAISTTLSVGLPMNAAAALFLSIALVPVSLLIDYLFKHNISSKQIN